MKKREQNTVGDPPWKQNKETEEAKERDNRGWQGQRYYQQSRPFPQFLFSSIL